ncbi:MAG: adenylate kinase family protein [Bythopirellula sp.]
MKRDQIGWQAGNGTPCEPEQPLPASPCRLVLLGPPGVGKGTQGSLLSERFRSCHLSTGDLFRSAQCEGASSPAMKQALAAMERGQLVSNEVVIAMIRERSACLRCQGGFLLDGFPRTVCQAEALRGVLEDLQVKLDAVICYELPIEEIVARLGGRRVCSSCQAVFHISNRPAAVANVCDSCQGQLVQRDDDQPEAIRVRLRAYEAETRPLTDFYERADKLLRVEATGTPQEVFDRTIKQLDRQSCALSTSEAVSEAT